jgi:hypothetical protein
MERDQLAPGDHLRGPAILVEPTATTYLDSDCELTVAPDTSLFIRVIAPVSSKS